MSRIPQFHNIAADVFPKFDVYGYIQDKYKLCKMNMIENYVKSHSNKFEPGDILFVGSTYDTRYYSNGFVLIGEEGKILGEEADSAVELPFRYKDHLPKEISYKQMFDKIVENIEDKIAQNKMMSDLDKFNFDFDFEYDFYINFFGIAYGDKPDVIYTVYESEGLF